MRKILFIITVMALTLALVVPAMAIVRWEFDNGAQVSTDAYLVFGTYYQTTDYRDSTTDDDTDLFWNHYGDSRATVSFSSGSLSGTYQIGFGADWSVSTRLMYGAWAVNDDLTVALGKMYAPYYMWGTSRLAGDLGLGGYGAAWDDFDPQFLITFKGFYVDLKKPVEPGMLAGHSYDTALSASDVDIDTSIPRVYVGYNGSVADTTFGAALGFNTINVKSVTANFDERINAWIAVLHTTVGLTDVFSFRVAGHYGANAEEMGIENIDGVVAGGASTTAGAVITASNKVEDTTTFAGFTELYAKIGKSVATVGYGYASSDNDTYSQKDAHQTFYVQGNIPIYQEKTTGATFRVYPEIAIFDEMKDKDGNKEPKYTYIGAVWQVSF